MMLLLNQNSVRSNLSVEHSSLAVAFLALDTLWNLT